MAKKQQSKLVPVTILTGFLGSGKTTLLNRILKEQHGHKIAVIENEFGEAGVDNEILIDDREEQIVEMNNGCICCTVRGDLQRILAELREKREKGKLWFERIIIETTGMADPGPVAQTFFLDEKIGDYYLLDSVITVVDAKHGQKTLDDFREAQDQVGFADRILLSKTDLVTEDEADKLRSRLVHMNPRAPVKKVNFGDAPVDEILDIRGFNLNAVLEIDPEFLEDAEHTHDEDVSSFVFRSSAPFNGPALEEFLSGIVKVYGENLLRYKGVLHVLGTPQRVIFQGLHMMASGEMGRTWGRDEKRSTTMVFIGRNMPQDMIMKGLERCLVRQ
jgi:G3E family GTPase